VFNKINTKAKIEYLNTKLKEFVIYIYRSIISTMPQLLA
jgi:hypothetical protein